MEAVGKQTSIVNDQATKTGQNLDELKNEIERLNRELAAAQQERSQSAAYGLELLNEKEKLQQTYESIKTLYDESKRELQELKDAWNKAVNEQRISATTVFEKEVQLLNDSDALAASFTHAKQEIEKELKQTKSLLDSAIIEKDRYLSERDELSKKVTTLEQERKNLKNELKDVNNRESKLLKDITDLNEDNVILQKQVSNLRCNQVEFESSKHEIQRLQDEIGSLNSHLEEVISLRRITERQMKEALEALQSEREQKYALRTELDKRNSADNLMNWSSLAALKGSHHLTNLALRNISSQTRSTANNNEHDNGGGSPNGFLDADSVAHYSDAVDPGFDVIHDLEMPSIEGSLFDEVHLSEIKKLQHHLDEKENQRSILNTKLIEVQHKLESKNRQAEEIKKKLTILSKLIECVYHQGQLNDSQQIIDSTTGHEDSINAQTAKPSTTDSSSEFKLRDPVDDFDNIYSHLENLFAHYKALQETKDALTDAGIGVKYDEFPTVASEPSLNQSSDQSIAGSDSSVKKDDSQDLVKYYKNLLGQTKDQMRQLRRVVLSNRESAEVALQNLKTKYDTEKAVVTETMTKLRLDLRHLQEDAATFSSLRSQMSARIEEYMSDIAKLQSKLDASDQEKNTLNSILRMAIEQKVMLTQKLEALEMDREPESAKGGANGQQSRSASGHMRMGSAAGNRGSPGARGGGGRPPRSGGRVR